MPHRLFTTHFRSDHPGRREEIEACLRLNIGQFDNVFVLAENEFKPGWFKGQWWISPKRQTVARLLEYAAEVSPLDVTVLANCDIVIDRPTLDLIAAHIEANQVYCLSRWDFIPARPEKRDRRGRLRVSGPIESGCVLFDRRDSQDAWVFRGPPKRTIGGDYYFGMPGTDNKLAYELQAAGYEVLNPSRDVRSYHPHVSGARTSNGAENRLPGPYLFIEPARLGEQPTYKVPRRISSGAGFHRI